MAATLWLLATLLLVATSISASQNQGAHDDFDPDSHLEETEAGDLDDEVDDEYDVDDDFFEDVDGSGGGRNYPETPMQRPVPPAKSESVLASFINRMSRPVWLFFRDNAKVEKPLQEVGAGGTLSMRSFPGQILLFREGQDASSGLLAEFLMSDSETQSHVLLEDGTPTSTHGLVKVEIFNYHDSLIDLGWVNPDDGSEKVLASVPAGQSFTLNSLPFHTINARVSGEVIKKVVVTAEKEQVHEVLAGEESDEL